MAREPFIDNQHFFQSHPHLPRMAEVRSIGDVGVIPHGPNDGLPYVPITLKDTRGSIMLVGHAYHTIGSADLRRIANEARSLIA